MSDTASHNPTIQPATIPTIPEMPGNFDESQESSGPGTGAAVGAGSAPPANEKAHLTPAGNGSKSSEKAASQKHAGEPQGEAAPEGKQGWPFLLDAAQRHDSAKIEKWKAELDNLLVFAGLFSGVLTAYTIESYSWLREDPAATTNRILLLMSAQLASFTTGPGFLNSTAPSAAQLADSFVFEPNSNDVLINTLWFVSLTFSLLASFFAIAAQQWIRALPLPDHLPLMHNIRLWECRHEQLLVWQLPNVIMILPVFLQIAVVLFIVGLYHLLRSLNHPVTAVFAVVSIVPFGLYAISLPAPLYWSSSPYKSPIIPLLALISKWAAVIVLFLVKNSVVRLSMSMLHKMGKGHDSKRHSLATHIVCVARIKHWLTQAIEGYEKRVFSVFYTHHDIFFARETNQLAVIRREDHRDYILKARGRALGRAPVVVSRADLSMLSSCFKPLPCHVRVSVMVQWLAMYFGTNEVNLRLSDCRSPVDRDLLARITAPFARDYTSFLLGALPREGELPPCERPQEGSVRNRDSPIHKYIPARITAFFARGYTSFLRLLGALLRRGGLPLNARPQEDSDPQPPRMRDWIYRVDDLACVLIFLTGIYMEGFTDSWPGARDGSDERAWIRRLMRLCRSQVLVESVPTSEDASMSKPSTQVPTSEADSAGPAAFEEVAVTSARYRFPTVCLHGAIAADAEFEFTSQEIGELLRLAEERIAHATLVCAGGESDKIVQVVDMVFGSVASSLLALTRQNAVSKSPSAPTTSVSHLLQEFTAFIDYSEPDKPLSFPHLESIQAAAELARRHGDGHRLVIVRRATVDIVNSLFVLRKRNDIDVHIVGKLVSTLSRLCAEDAQELKPRPAFVLQAPVIKLPRVGRSNGVQGGDWKDEVESEVLSSDFNTFSFWERLQYLKNKAPVPSSSSKSRSFADEEPSLNKDAPPPDPDDVWRSD